MRINSVILFAASGIHKYVLTLHSVDCRWTVLAWSVREGMETYTGKHDTSSFQCSERSLLERRRGELASALWSASHGHVRVKHDDTHCLLDWRVVIEAMACQGYGLS